ncbi:MULTISPECIES: aldo/keto reductase [Dickeya]|uniref:Oxidoreductase YeaE, aldo/keto reductase family n=1 Tax=Dickeya aquatica TaxID=1401087 RepID=A0A375AAV9_9GAMM|nr:MULTISPECIES: aldo/keto reductase [Dickeya]SLM63175.1 Putative oxidoreductase YeaE, aldo/keto reductase family [Dickeya aquatica]
MRKQVMFTHGTTVAAIGQGTWFMGEHAQQWRNEVRALQAGIDLGMTLIDTAEMYADGRAEQVVGEAIRGRRERVYLVSKVYPHNAGGARAIAACEGSLKRLQTERIDLYLLHWRGGIPLPDTISAMETLCQSGKIGHWGVSNLDMADMAELWGYRGAEQCQTNQVLYHLGSRGIEYDLLPWCQQRHMPVMAYCPLAQAGQLSHDLMNHPSVIDIARQRGLMPAQVLLAWVIRQSGVIAIPKASSLAHVEQNAAALSVTLSQEEIACLDRAYPAPRSKQPLDVV